MCRKGLSGSDMGLTVMINEKLPPKITSYFALLLTFFVKITDRKAKGKEYKALKKITAKMSKSKRSACLVKIKLENLGRSGM